MKISARNLPLKSRGAEGYRNMSSVFLTAELWHLVMIEHYWGYTSRRDSSTGAYRIANPKWRVWPATRSTTAGDFTGFYGDQFAAVFARPPGSVFVAEGSPVVVHPAAALER